MPFAASTAEHEAGSHATTLWDASEGSEELKRAENHTYLRKKGQANKKQHASAF